MEHLLRQPDQPPPPTSIDDLPDDCLQQIFQRISDHTFLPLQWPAGTSNRGKNRGTLHPLHCAFVCQRWRDAADAAVERLNFDSAATINPDTFIRRIARFQMLTSVHFLYCHITPRAGSSELVFFSRLAAALPGLVELRFLPKRGGSGVATPPGLASDLASAIPLWTQLSALHLGDIFQETDSQGFLDLLEALPHAPLRQLAFRYQVCAHVSLETVCSKLRSIRTLEELEFETSDVPPPSMVGFAPLQILSLSGFPRERLPETVGSFRHLTALIVESSERLAALPGSVGSLPALRRLWVIDCDVMRVLPDSLSGLTGLEFLAIDDCLGLQALPASLATMRSLSILRLRGCHSLTRLGRSLEGLSRLTHLEISDCRSLSLLPSYIGRLPQLRELIIKGNRITELPAAIGGLRSLVSLRVSEIRLHALPDTIGTLSSLKLLDLSNCSILKRLPESSSWLASLEYLLLGGCTSLSRLPSGITSLLRLKSLDFSNCSMLQCVPTSLGGLTNLKHLNVRLCTSLERLPASIGRRAAQGSLVLHADRCHFVESHPGQSFASHASRLLGHK